MTELWPLVPLPAGEPLAEPDVKPEEQPTPTEPPRRRIAMSAAGRAVEVEAPDELDALAYLAMELWKFTDDPRIVVGGSTTVGFHTETAHTDQASYAPDDDRARPDRPAGPRMSS